MIRKEDKYQMNDKKKQDKSLTDAQRAMIEKHLAIEDENAKKAGKLGFIHSGNDMDALFNMIKDIAKRDSLRFHKVLTDRQEINGEFRTTLTLTLSSSEEILNNENQDELLTDNDKCPAEDGFNRVETKHPCDENLVCIREDFKDGFRFSVITQKQADYLDKVMNIMQDEKAKKILRDTAMNLEKLGLHCHFNLADFMHGEQQDMALSLHVSKTEKGVLESVAIHRAGNHYVHSEEGEKVFEFEVKALEDDKRFFPINDDE